MQYATTAEFNSRKNAVLAQIKVFFPKKLDEQLEATQLLDPAFPHSPHLNKGSTNYKSV